MIVMELKSFCRDVRLSILDQIFRSKKSHIGSCFSCVEILAVLYQKVLNISEDSAHLPLRDRFILSKGHAALAYYATLFQLGYISKQELESFSVKGSYFIEHPNAKIRGIEFSSGSLGLGLSVGTGMALVSKREALSCRVFVLVSDGELQEGSTWEAMMFASQHRLNNLTVIVDYNKLQALGEVDSICSFGSLKDKLKAFGFCVLEVNGHNTFELETALKISSDEPKAIIANTHKGYGVSFMKDSLMWHYKNPNAEEYLLAKEELVYQE